MGCTVIDCGLRPAYFRDVLTRFLAQINAALTTGEPLHYGRCRADTSPLPYRPFVEASDNCRLVTTRPDGERVIASPVIDAGHSGAAVLNGQPRSGRAR